MPEAANIKLDPFDPEFARDPYAVYDGLRDLDEPYFFEAQNMHMLARYEDVRTIATSPHSVRSLVGIASDDEIAE